jgi:hypothetical protein
VYDERRRRQRRSGAWPRRVSRGKIIGDKKTPLWDQILIFYKQSMGSSWRWALFSLPILCLGVGKYHVMGNKIWWTLGDALSMFESGYPRPVPKFKWIIFFIHTLSKQCGCGFGYGYWIFTDRYMHGHFRKCCPCRLNFEIKGCANSLLDVDI